MKKRSMFTLLVGLAALVGDIADADAGWGRVRHLDEQARIVIEDFGPDTVVDLIDDVYAEDVRFQDPLEVHEGRAEVLEYLLGVYQTLAIVDGPHMIDLMRGFNKRVAVWETTMQFQVPIPQPDGSVVAIPLGPPVLYEGTTVFYFNYAGKIVSHRDYFDQTPLFNIAFDSLALFQDWIGEQLGAILGAP